MTNEEIIRNARAAAGIIEEAHTYAHWRSLGFQVRKGEHAAFQTVIWKYPTRKGDPSAGESEEVTQVGGKPFLKKASFFTASQVDPIPTRKEQERQAGITSAILAATLPA